MLKMYPSTEARISLAIQFDLPYQDSMQDWEWEIAEPARFHDYLNAYLHFNLNEAMRWSLMEILIQCIEEMPGKTDFCDALRKIEPLLRYNASLHIETIRYWACIDTKLPEQLFRVSQTMRAILKDCDT